MKGIKLIVIECGDGFAMGRVVMIIMLQELENVWGFRTKVMNDQNEMD